MKMTREEGINKTFPGISHLVILGAGASIASTMRNPEKNGKELPSMNNFIDVVGLNDIIEELPDEVQDDNFEKLYSNLHAEKPKSDEIKEIQRRVRDYFSDMELPDEPTIYDYLILSLRPKDFIATFNWDPFLYQAFCRNMDKAPMPHICFLHGNVAIGYSDEDDKTGPSGMYSKRTGNQFEPTKLLYPVAEKNYNNDQFISREWNRFRTRLESDDTKRVTIFGYGAPDTDVEAIDIMKEAWGGAEERNMEQFELINVIEKGELRETWDDFIHTHHYDYGKSFFDSILAKYPRRTGERYMHQFLPTTPAEAFQEPFPVPQDVDTLEELWDWYEPLFEVERA